MPRFAAIDAGSNASRLVIAQAKSSEDVRPLRAMRIPVRLGHAVFQTGRLDPETMEQSVEAMRSFAAEMERFR
ncbi:MAG: Ppx/GppA family phosphatase, partial [Myxococcales bacterium]|nr:Ppx/GppA family phosphatase [Myxococcales bacterium]